MTKAIETFNYIIEASHTNYFYKASHLKSSFQTMTDSTLEI